VRKRNNKDGVDGTEWVAEGDGCGRRYVVEEVGQTEKRNRWEGEKEKEEGQDREERDAGLEEGSWSRCLRRPDGERFLYGLFCCYLFWNISLSNGICDS
jgi:hypothetical protein